MKQIGARLHRRFVGIDEGNKRISLFDTDSSEVAWSFSIAEDYPLCRDMQRIGPDLALIGFDRGFFELEISTGRVARLREGWKTVTGAHRLPDGRTLVTGIDLDGTRGVNVITLDPELRIERIDRRDGDYVRLLRPTPDGSYLLCVDDHLLETTRELVALREFRAPGFRHAWKSHRFADGSTLASAGYGAFMARFDKDARLVRTFGGAGQVPPEIEPFFYATFQVMDDGIIVVANWEDHGPGNGHKGRQLLEFSADGEFLGSWSDQERISSLQGLLLL